MCGAVMPVMPGFAAIRELSSKWALAVSLGLDREQGGEDGVEYKNKTQEQEQQEKTLSMKSRRRKMVGPRNAVGGISWSF